MPAMANLSRRPTIPPSSTMTVILNASATARTTDMTIVTTLALLLRPSSMAVASVWAPD
jgi:hypothetical protein